VGIDRQAYPPGYAEGVDFSDPAARQEWMQQQAIKATEVYHRTMNELAQTDVCACCWEYVAPIHASWHRFDGRIKRHDSNEAAKRI